jgi:hypothetical protein
VLTTRIKLKSGQVGIKVKYPGFKDAQLVNVVAIILLIRAISLVRKKNDSPYILIWLELFSSINYITVLILFSIISDSQFASLLFCLEYSKFHRCSDPN